MPTLMKAVQVSVPGGDFELVQREIPEPADNEVQIKVEACGICRGDAAVKDGLVPSVKYPRVPGHEIVGIIKKLGSAVHAWQVGQRVGVGWYGGPCHKCESCLKGEFGHCKSSLTTGISLDGGYAEYAVAAQQALVLIPDGLKPYEAAPLMCAGRTTYSALQNSGAKGGDLVAIKGLGGLGHLAVQFCRKLGFKTVALSRGKEKESLAYELGAHVFIDMDNQNAVDELKKLGGARVILDTAPNGTAISEMLDGLAPGGRLVYLSAPREPVNIMIGKLMGGKSIQGSSGGTAHDALAFSVIADVHPMVELFPLEQAALAYEKMMTSKVHFRAVLFS
jgi:propanol-preferring alcohol dehydrogenase